MWGTMASSGQLDMTIGAPATTLARAGIAGLPAEFVLAIPVHGTREAPLVNWTRSACFGYENEEFGIWTWGRINAGQLCAQHVGGPPCRLDQVSICCGWT